MRPLRVDEGTHHRGRQRARALQMEAARRQRERRGAASDARTPRRAAKGRKMRCICKHQPKGSWQNMPRRTHGRSIAYTAPWPRTPSSRSRRNGSLTGTVRQRFACPSASTLRNRSTTCSTCSPTLGRGPARRPPRRLHGDRHRRALQAHARLQRPAPDGLGRVRPAGRAVRDQDRHAPARHDRAQHQTLPRAAEGARLLATTGSARSTRRTPATTSGRSGSSSSCTSAASRIRRSCPSGGARSSARCWPTKKCIDGKVRGPSAAIPRRAPAVAPVGAEDHRLRRRACSPTWTRSTGPSQHEGDAAQLDRPQRRRGDRLSSSTGTAEPITAARVHHRGPTRCSARPTWCWRPSIRWSTKVTTREQRAAVDAYRAAASAQERARAHRARQGQDRRVHRRVRAESRDGRQDSRSGSPTTCWWATAPARSWPCPAATSATSSSPQKFGLPVIRTVVEPPADFDGKKRVHRRRRGDQQPAS